MSGFLRRNIVWMLFSLAFSIALWTIVTNQQARWETDYFQNVAVKVRGEPEGLVARDALSSVRVKVTAPSDVWKRLTSGSFQVYVDASRVGPGVEDVPVQVESLEPRARVEEVQPAKVTLRLERIATKEVPTKINLIGTVPFGYNAKTPQVSPHTVNVSGPQSQVEQVASAVVDFRLDGIRSSVNQPFKPVLQSEDGTEIKSVSVRPESVIVEMVVDRDLSYKTVPVTPKVVGTVAMGYQIVGIMVEPTTVTVVGDPNELNSLTYASTRQLDVSGAKGDLTATVEPELPNGVSLARRQSFIVRVYVGAVESSEIIRVAPSIKGDEIGHQSSVSPPFVDVVVSGPMPVLSTLKPQDIKITADVTGLLTGAHSISPTVTIPSGLRLNSIRPEQVTVDVR
ncbi:MAG: CdaR family protein [Chloroflexi bacterium]|nr:CdaR family protein [Chloroflexota bacterium]